MDNIFDLVAAYARVSTDSENQLNSFNNQMGYFKNAINNVDGLKFYKMYSDKGLSGVYWKKRDGFNKMLHDAGIDVVKKYDYRTKQTQIQYSESARKPKFKYIWIKNSARFARNILSWEIIRLLRKKGVYILFLNNNICTEDESKDLQLQIQMSMDENESRVKSEAVKWGYSRGKENGNIYTHPRLTGYDYIKDKNKLVKNKDAAAVKLIFELCVYENMGIRKIINELQARGIKNPSGGDRWGSTTVKNVLHQEKYMGKNNPLRLDHGRFGEKTWAHRKAEYDLLDTDRIEPIITEELFEAAQKKLSERTITTGGHTRGTRHSYSRYAKKIMCANCGAYYIRNTDYKDVKKTIKYSFFNCNNKRKLGASFCSNPNVMEDELDDIVRGFSYGKINEEIISRQTTYSYMLLKVAEMETDEIDDESESVSSILKDKISTIKDKIKSYIIKMTENPELDKYHVFSDLVEEENKKLDELTAEYEKATTKNKIINDNVLELVLEYEKIRDFKYIQKQRYSEDEILDMIDIIYVATPINPDDRNDLRFTFEIYKQSRELLKRYEKKYNFKVQNLEGSTPESLPNEQKEVNTLYTKLNQKLKRD